MKNNTNCIICYKEFYLKPYHKKRYKGPFSCSRTCRAKFISKQYSGINNPNSVYLNNLDKFLFIRAKDIKNRANKKKIECTITGQDLIDIYNEQNGLCFYTGIPLKLGSDSFNQKGQSDLDSLSVDRIDSSFGYLKNNIVLCCNAINKLKGNASIDNFSEFLTLTGFKHFGTCKVNFKKVRENAINPKRAKLGDGGFDICAAKVEETDTQIKVYTGLATQPSPGWVLYALPRSSIYKKGLMLSNSIGLIDNQYTGEIMAIFNKISSGAKIEIGERVIQLMPIKLPFVQFIEVDKLTETERGEGGFGSTEK